jgi:hypothetical protein
METFCRGELWYMRQIMYLLSEERKQEKKEKKEVDLIPNSLKLG